MKRKAILVTGSRDWLDDYAVTRALIDAGGGHLRVLLIHGDCRGADRMAAAYAQGAAGWTELAMPAPWEEHGKAAGPGRNARMLAFLESLQWCGYDCEVHAFPLPLSRGTRHMMKIARDAGFVVHDHGRSI